MERSHQSSFPFDRSTNNESDIDIESEPTIGPIDVPDNIELESALRSVHILVINNEIGSDISAQHMAALFILTLEE